MSIQTNPKRSGYSFRPRKQADTGSKDNRDKQDVRNPRNEVNYGKILNMILNSSPCNHIINADTLRSSDLGNCEMSDFEDMKNQIFTKEIINEINNECNDCSGLKTQCPGDNHRGNEEKKNAINKVFIHKCKYCQHKKSPSATIKKISELGKKQKTWTFFRTKKENEKQRSINKATTNGKERVKERIQEGSNDPIRITEITNVSQSTGNVNNINTNISRNKILKPSSNKPTAININLNVLIKNNIIREDNNYHKHGKFNSFNIWGLKGVAMSDKNITMSPKSIQSRKLSEARRMHKENISKREKEMTWNNYGSFLTETLSKVSSLHNWNWNDDAGEPKKQAQSEQFDLNKSGTSKGINKIRTWKKMEIARLNTLY